MTGDQNTGWRGRNGVYRIQYKRFLTGMGRDCDQTTPVTDKGLSEVFKLIMIDTRGRQGSLEVAGTGDLAASQFAQASGRAFVSRQDQIETAKELPGKARPDLPSLKAFLRHAGIDECGRYSPFP